MTHQPSVAIIGGGLAGLAAASVLGHAGWRVDLYETRSRLGGRAGSYHDPQTDQWIDHCQHVAMGCCTCFVDFIHRTRIEEFFRRDRTVHFFDLEGRQVPLTGARWLPAPLHLAPFLLRLKYLTWAERWRVAAALWNLARSAPQQLSPEATIGEWLQQHRQTKRALDRFWAPVLVSALSETLDRASLTAAHQVFIDGFMKHPRAYELLIPQAPLSQIYDQFLATHLTQHGVTIHRGTHIKQVCGSPDGKMRLHTVTGVTRTFDATIAAVPWRHIGRLLDPHLRNAIPQLDQVDRLASAPITSLHLWFDRPIMHLPHAVLIDRLAQWVFQRGAHASPTFEPTYYYQVVISASRHLVDLDPSEVLDRVVHELTQLWPSTAAARLVRSQLIQQREAVFSVVPGLRRRRPPQITPVDGLLLAGDWTDTGWPATMESAVRSGYLAANAALQSHGLAPGVILSELPSGWLFRRLFGR